MSNPKIARLDRQILNVKNAISDITDLKNSINDLLPYGVGDGGNTLSGIETLINANRYMPITIQRLTIAYLYQEHGIIQAAIDVPVQDALRGGIDITSAELDADDIKDLQEDMENSGDWDKIEEAIRWKRLFGGSGLIINIEVDPAQPFNNKFTGDLDFYACDRWELSGSSAMADTFDFYGTKLHRSRVIQFFGKKAPSQIRTQLQGWGMSDVERMVQDLNAYIKNREVIFELLDEAKIDVYRLKGFNLNTAANNPRGTALVKKRIEISNQLKRFDKALIMDSEDEYEQKTLTFAGLSDMLEMNQVGLASSIRMPMAKLFGLQAAGFADGEDSIENYNAFVESEIRTPSRQQIRAVVSLRMIQKFGYVPAFQFKFKPLRVLSEKDEEAIKTSRQARLKSAYDDGMMNSEEFGQAARHYDLFPGQLEAEQGLLPPQPPKPGAGQQPGIPGQEGEEPDPFKGKGKPAGKDDK